MARTLSAHHLAKAYGGRPVVKDVSLRVGAEIVGLLGPNGAGKTTCFYMIVGLVEADASDGLRLDDESLMAMPMHRRAAQASAICHRKHQFFDSSRCEIICWRFLRHAPN